MYKVIDGFVKYALENPDVSLETLFNQYPIPGNCFDMFPVILCAAEAARNASPMMKERLRQYYGNSPKSF